MLPLVVLLLFVVAIVVVVCVVVIVVCGWLLLSLFAVLSLFVASFVAFCFAGVSATLVLTFFSLLFV